MASLSFDSIEDVIDYLSFDYKMDSQLIRTQIKKLETRTD